MSLKIENLDVEKFEVIYDIIPIDDQHGTNQLSDTLYEREKIVSEIRSIDNELEEIEAIVANLNKDIDKLTNHADNIDYISAALCGVVTGIIDSMLVGDWDFAGAKAKANEDVNTMVLDFAKKDPRYNSWCIKNNKDNNRLKNAVQFLEKQYKLPGDGSYRELGQMGITHKTHHLDDFCHHPTLVGLLCCIIVQFTGSTKYYCEKGVSDNIVVNVNDYGNFVSEDTWGKVFSGIINWFFTVAKTIQNRNGHLMSDMAGSLSSTKKGNDGAGIPGSFMSTLKELSSLPCFKDTEFSSKLKNAYQNGIGTDKGVNLGAFNELFKGASSKFDMRTEMAVKSELKRQAFPVILNEILVRGMYFVRRFVMEMRDKESISQIEWNNVIPIGNRTIERMMTIATGTFVSFDMIDAMIRSGGINSTMLLRINFVGIGRFVVAIGVDAGLGIKRSKLRDERIYIINKQLVLLNAKVFYNQAVLNYKLVDVFNEQEQMWLSAADTEKTLQEAYKVVQQEIAIYNNEMEGISRSLQSISDYRTGMNEYNPDVLKELVDILKWS